MTIIPALRGQVSIVSAPTFQVATLGWVGASALDGVVIPDFKFRYFSVGTSIVLRKQFEGEMLFFAAGFQKNQTRVRGDIVIST